MGMIDIGEKKTTLRAAEARATVCLPPEVFALIDDQEILSPKGPVFYTAILAGTMAAKKTPETLPYCHPIPLESCDLTITPLKNGLIEIRAAVSANAKTGVEMEALSAVSAAALTIYDMLKYRSSEIEIKNIFLIKKTGGKNDYERKI